MFRALCVAVALAMTPAGASAQAASAQAIPPGWEFIQLKDWTYAASTENLIVFFMVARQPMHIWARYEFKRPDPSGLRSWTELVQVDCSGGRTKVVTGNQYSGSKLEGHIRAFGPDDWTYPRPGSFGDSPLMALCD